MLKRWAALALVLALGALMPQNAEGQATQRKSGVRQNYPNPFNPETYIPFTIWEPSCEQNSSSQFEVSIRIVSILGQTVAIPILQEPAAGSASSGLGSRRLHKMKLACGDYTAFWNGKLLNSGKEAPSTVYIAEISVNGRVVQTIRMVIQK